MTKPVKPVITKIIGNKTYYYNNERIDIKSINAMHINKFIYHPNNTFKKYIDDCKANYKYDTRWEVFHIFFEMMFFNKKN